METKEVWVITYFDESGFGGVFGVYSTEDSADDALWAAVEDPKWSQTSFVLRPEEVR